MVIGFKPEVDAYCIASGGKQEARQAVIPTVELTSMKFVEIFADAIPGMIIQLMAIATSPKDVGVLPWVSVGVSALTTGFVSASLS